MKGKIAPSVMCVDYTKFEETLRAFEAGGVEYLHVDVMDGTFVPNYAVGPDFCRALKAATSIPLDIHLMVVEPERKIDWFDVGARDFVAVHYESTYHPARALAAVRAHGARPMLALNPATPVSVLEHVLNDVEGVLIMTVNPGFAGQKLIESTIDKIARTRAFLDERGATGVSIEVDGNVSFENATRMRQAGADLFVAGTSSVFSPAGTLGANIARMRLAIQ